MQMTKPMSAIDWGLIVALSVIWGGAFFFIEIILREVPPNTMVFLRLLLAIPPLLFWLRVTGMTMPLDRKSWMQFFVIGALNVALPYILFGYAQVHISSGLASVLNATTPLWGVLVAHFLTHDEKATSLRVAGVVIGFLGVAVMLGSGLETGSRDVILGQVACVVATLFYALTSVYARGMGERGLQPMQIATGQIVAATVLMVPVVLVTEPPHLLTLPGAPVVAAMLALSIISTSLAYVLYFKLLANVGAANSLLITFLIPVTAIMLGFAFLGEIIEPRQVAGMSLIAIGLLALDGRMFGRLAAMRNVP